MRRLNFGCGSIQPEGWENVDKEDFGQRYIGTTHVFNDYEFDYIVAHCTLQINDFNEIIGLLSELRRILKPNGVLRISLPDISEGFKHYSEGDIDWFPNGESDLDTRFSAWLTWYSTTRTLLTPRALIQKLNEAGFSQFELASFGESKLLPGMAITDLDTRQHECYFMEARK